MLHLPSIITLCLLIKTTFANLSVDNAGWHGLSDFDITNYVSNDHNIHQNIPSHGSYSSFENGGDFHLDMDQGFKDSNIQHTIVQAVPINEHVEITKPVPIPVIKNIGIPVPQHVSIPVPHPMAVGVAQPYPVHVPVIQHIPVPVVKTIAIPVEKKVPYPVEKIIPVPVEKPVPITIEKHVPVPVEKLYPIHIPIYKHVFHRRKTKKRGRKWYY
ncbi:PREDICTED: zinc finger protein 512B-like [Atta colombica]|uniref:zinc finger protein 512B-like n=1 Tax=Atta colombica TaxID=520822 RepID=UPI00084C9FF5|nr:PREDICTED: zinc finger protein 512B-like [Atta colombica]